ncbi:MAG TPA: hemolysin family protein [Bryobacteraceae bacterium]|nr:hemolysin family protein [Bryobacteraceae bacterium]
MLLAVLIILSVLVIAFAAIQILYMESMRLRTRDLPALHYFKTELEDSLGMRPEIGSLSFSLWKHTCLISFGVVALLRAMEGRLPEIWAIVEALLVAWAGMVVCAYAVPQVLYRRTSGHWLRAVVPFYKVSAIVIRPLVALLSFGHSLLEIVNPEPEESEPATAAENIEALISAGEEEGLIEKDDRQLIQSVVEFGDKTVREVMTPRPNIVAIAGDRTLEELHALVVTEQYSRIPVYRTCIDDIAGFVHVRDMFEVAESSRRTRRVVELMRPIKLVPETKLVADLMRDMQREGAHIVIVVDEYGATAGLASMEDLVEVIVGEIRDEHEPGSDVADDGHGGHIVSGSFDLARLSSLLGFQPHEEVESTTIGGLAMEWMERVPRPGETIEREGLRIEVLASDEKRVGQVRLSKVPTEALPK